MIAYNSKSLDNRDIQEQAEDAKERAFITPEELEAVKAAYPVDLYTPNPYMRIGIFILTTIIMQFSFGLFCLIMVSAMSEKAFSVLCFFFGAGSYALAEFMVKDKKHYKSGADAALIWIAGGFILGGVILAANAEGNPWGYCLVTLLLSTLFVLRFADVGMSIVAHLSLLALLFSILEYLGTPGKIVVPFTVMLISLGVYIVSLKLSKIHTYRHYKTCLQVLQGVSLLTLYLGGNYFVVRELSIEMFNLDLAEGQDIAGGWIFWILTVALPLLYIYLGIRRKDRILIGVGLLLIAVMVYTIRYYHSVAPLEVAMTVGGLVMIGIAYGLIRYLKVPRNGFTADSANERNMMEAVQIESLIIAQTMSHTPSPQPDQYNYGGGTGGGGGASGEY
ncbi:hypothetical protein [Chitinophaga pinensis]|uniref:Uncharacterized protein n=1 Tax=Chitinophaga pinensis (strain ATCC 43595 / DSM 2588 / LMG 13176 / NBRC 15968 / NCIMB 11800 / UQM 2034) TaxID=485918 RepID=A0A979G3F1_CHIPD|nr:hypothetical protein [Chitinophaga pinensis]ACU60075.1 hypothetical protein Cpin_2592 [Chitinophaga pinensis DSM 2588]